MERLSVKSRIGTTVLRSLGNASPKELHMQHAVGAALVDLGGRWLRDADVDFQVAFVPVESTIVQVSRSIAQRSRLLHCTSASRAGISQGNRPLTGVRTLPLVPINGRTT